MTQKTDNVRTKLFLEISQACYLEYKKWLIENHAVDFEDMINESARVLNNVKEMKQKLDCQSSPTATTFAEVTSEKALTRSNLCREIS